MAPPTPTTNNATHPSVATATQINDLTLLNLPAELRILVYESLIESQKLPVHQAEEIFTLDIRPLRACHQVRWQMLPVYDKYLFQWYSEARKEADNAADRLLEVLDPGPWLRESPAIKKEMVFWRERTMFLFGLLMSIRRQIKRMEEKARDLSA